MAGFGVKVAVLLVCAAAASSSAPEPSAKMLRSSIGRSALRHMGKGLAFSAPSFWRANPLSFSKPAALAKAPGLRLKPAVAQFCMAASAEKTAGGDSKAPEADGSGRRKHFISNMIEKDLEIGKHTKVITRFPPEPNGYLHIGHAKSICLNFGMGDEFKGETNMRFDDTNPEKEDQEYVDSILEDVRWLVGGSTGASDPWAGDVRYASDYFDVFYDAAVHLIKKGKAYVESLSAEEMREYRGTLTEPGKESPYRDRSVEENLEMFQKMRDGGFEEGEVVLRAKIDMSSPNMNMRDPALYRIRKASHVKTGDKWIIYPMYDFAHCISDALEGITHSLCTLEFEDHRPLYDWVLDELEDSDLISCHPQQTEFSRLNLQYTVLSKRKLIQLVEGKYVNGWSDPRMPTISGIRRRGFTPAAMQLFAERIGISKADNNIDMSVLEDCAREVLEDEAVRGFAVLDPIKVTISNWPEGEVETFEAPAHPKKDMGTRKIPFTKTVYIDADDFNEDPPKGYFRLTPGGMVRLKFAYVIKCEEVKKDSNGKVIEIVASYIPETRAGAKTPETKKVKGIIQWVSAEEGIPCEFRIYDRLFTTPLPGKDQEDGDFLKDLNPDSLQTVKGFCEPSVKELQSSHLQFERVGYFTPDSVDSKPEDLVFNRVVSLRDNWSKEDQKPKQKPQQAKAAAPGGADIEGIRRLDIRVGKILEAEKHPDADALYVEKIDLGDEEGPRTIVSGLAKYIPLEDLKGRYCTVLCNLKPAKMRGIESAGMVLCGANDEEGVVELLEPPEGAKVGERITVDGYEEPNPDPVLKSKTQQKVWPAVAEDLKTNAEGQAEYKGAPLRTSAGPLSCSSLKDCPIG